MELTMFKLKILNIKKEIKTYLDENEAKEFSDSFDRVYKESEIILSKFYSLGLFEMLSVVTISEVRNLIQKLLILLQKEINNEQIADFEWQEIATQGWEQISQIKRRNGVDMCIARAICRACEVNSTDKKTKHLRFPFYEQNQSNGFFRNLTHCLAPSRKDEYFDRVNTLGISKKIVQVWAQTLKKEEKMVAIKYSNLLIQCLAQN